MLYHTFITLVTHMSSAVRFTRTNGGMFSMTQASNTVYL